MVRIYDNDNDLELGTVTEAQMDFLQEELMEDAIDSLTFSVSSTSIDSLELNGGDPTLIALLRRALGPRVSMDLRFDLG